MKESLEILSHIWVGGCANWSQIPSNRREELHGKYDWKSCNLECNKRDWCTNFFLGKGKKAGICFPYAAGCTKARDSDVDYFKKYEVELKPECYQNNHSL